jgi:peroxiredoxin
VTALPTTFFIDPQGTIREVVVGGPMSEAAIEARVRTLLSEGAR